MATHSSILAWKIHGQRTLADHISWGSKELDVTEHTNITLLTVTAKYVLVYGGCFWTTWLTRC